MVDIILENPSHIPALGGEGKVKKYQLDVGGNSGITAVAFSRMGWKSGILGEIGTDLLGSFISSSLAAEGVDLTHLKASTNPTCISIELSFPEDRVTFVAGEGRLGAWRNSTSKLHCGILDRYDHLHLSILNSDSAKMLRAAKRRGLSTSIDCDLQTRGQLRRIALLGKTIDYLFLNKHEIPQGLQPAQAAAELGSIVNRCAIVKVGSGGAIAGTGRNVVTASAFDVPVRDTTGAGDAFAVGFLTAQRFALSLEDSLIVGNAAGAICIQRVGGVVGLPRLTDVLHLLRKRWPKLAAFLAQASRT